METLLLLVVFGLFFVLILAIGTAAFITYKYFSLRSHMFAAIQQAVQGEVQRWRAQEIGLIRHEQMQIAQSEFQKLRETETDSIRKEQLQIAQSKAKAQLQEWMEEEEERIREDMIYRSQKVTVGKVTEHFIPYLPDFDFNPKDARFIGSPIDFIIFDGLNGGIVRRVVFVEVKTGKSTLNQRERQIRDAIRSRRVKWVELRHESNLDLDPSNLVPEARDEDKGEDNSDEDANGNAEEDADSGSSKYFVGDPNAESDE